MNLFKNLKKTSQVVPPKENNHLKSAKEISEKYENLQHCYSILSHLQNPKSCNFGLHTSGWHIAAYTITDAGIDIKEVYLFIKLLAEKRKHLVESELAQLDVSQK